MKILQPCSRDRISLIYCLHIFAVNYGHFLRTNGRQVLSIRRDDKIPKNMQVKHFFLWIPLYSYMEKNQ